MFCVDKPESETADQDGSSDSWPCRPRQGCPDVSPRNDCSGTMERRSIALRLPGAVFGMICPIERCLLPTPVVVVTPLDAVFAAHWCLQAVRVTAVHRIIMLDHALRVRMGAIALSGSPSNRLVRHFRYRCAGSRSGAGERDPLCGAKF